MRGKRWRRYESLSIRERYTVGPYQASVNVTVPPSEFRPERWSGDLARRLAEALMAVATRLSSASSYSSSCQSPTPFSPTSRMNASACAISSAKYGTDLYYRCV